MAPIRMNSHAEGKKQRVSKSRKPVQRSVYCEAAQQEGAALVAGAASAIAAIGLRNQRVRTLQCAVSILKGVRVLAMLYTFVAPPDRRSV